MGTHFLSSPLKPALQGRDSGKAYEHQGQHDVQEDMGTHFITSPSHPAQQSEQPRAKVAGAQRVRDAGEMGTHFLSSPDMPEEQPRVRAAAHEENARDAGEMGTHFLSSPDRPEEQPRVRAAAQEENTRGQGNMRVQDAGEMGTHFIQSPDSPMTQAEESSTATTIKHEARATKTHTNSKKGNTHTDKHAKIADKKGVNSAYVHSSDDEADAFGTHFIGSASSFHANSAKPAPRRVKHMEDKWDTQSGVLSNKDRVGDSPFVVTREQGSEEGGEESSDNVLKPEDQVGAVEYTSDDYAGYHAGQRDPDLTFGPNTVAAHSDSPHSKSSSRNEPLSSDGATMPMGTNFVASKQGKPYSKDDVVSRQKPFSSDFPVPWSGTNSVFIGSHQGGDSTFSHHHGETDAAPGVINTVGRGSQRGYIPAGGPPVLPGGAPPMADAAPPRAGAQDTAPNMARADEPEIHNLPPNAADTPIGAPLASASPQQMPAPSRMAAQATPPLGGQPYALDAKMQYDAKKMQDKQDEERMMGIPNQPAARPCTSCVPKGGPSN